MHVSTLSSFPAAVRAATSTSTPPASPQPSAPDAAAQDTQEPGKSDDKQWIEVKTLFKKAAPWAAGGLVVAGIAGAAAGAAGGPVGTFAGAALRHTTMLVGAGLGLAGVGYAALKGTEKHASLAIVGGLIAAVPVAAVGGLVGNRIGLAIGMHAGAAGGILGGVVGAVALAPVGGVVGGLAGISHEVKAHPESYPTLIEAAKKAREEEQAGQTGPAPAPPAEPGEPQGPATSPAPPAEPAEKKSGFGWASQVVTIAAGAGLGALAGASGHPYIAGTLLFGAGGAAVGGIGLYRGAGKGIEQAEKESAEGRVATPEEMASTKRSLQLMAAGAGTIGGGLFGALTGLAVASQAVGGPVAGAVTGALVSGGYSVITGGIGKALFG